MLLAEELEVRLIVPLIDLENSEHLPGIISAFAFGKHLRTSINKQ